jgi:hypothetical protein
MPKECTDGEWPCEMSTYIAGVDVENVVLKDFLKEILGMIDDRESMQILGLMMLAPISRKIKAFLEKYPDFIREREKNKEKKYPLSEIKEAFWEMFHKSGEFWFEYKGSDEFNNKSTQVEWDEFLEYWETK